MNVADGKPMQEDALLKIYFNCPDLIFKPVIPTQ